MIRAEIRKHNNSPSIFINDTLFPPMMATIRTNSRESIIFDDEYFSSLGKSGIKIFFLICDTEWTKEGSHARFKEEAEKLLKAVPDAYIIARIGLHPPAGWEEENPEECLTYNDGERPAGVIATESFRTEYKHVYSLCSQKWREDGAKALNETCDFIDGLPFADRVAGFFFAAGGTSEWYYVRGIEEGERYADFSKAFQREYSALYSDPKIPGMEERYFSRRFDENSWDYGRPAEFANQIQTNGTNIGSFLDVDKYGYTASFYRALHLGTARSINFFAKIIKERYNNTKLTGSFYGSYGACDFFHGGTAGGVLEILDSGSLDFLAAPGVYVNRQPGGFTGQREMADSFRLRNMIYIAEEDSRTHLEIPHYRAMFDYYDMSDTANILKRDFARILCDDIQGWWFDQHLGGGRYRHEDIYKLFSRQHEIAKAAYSTDRAKQNEIACIYDEESISLISNQSTKDMVEYFRNYEIARVGTGFDHYFHNDLKNPAMPDYKLYIFFNTLSLTDSERKEIHAKLRKNNATALWVYASGVINPDAAKKFDAKHISELTGINTAVLHEKCHTKYRVNQKTELFKNLNGRKIYGVNDRPFSSNVIVAVKHAITFAAPLFYSDDSSALVAASFLTNGLPAVSVKECDGFTSIFCGSKILNSDIVRSIARFANCHIYSSSDDVIYANESFLCIHASTDGRKTIKFKTPCSPYEVYQKKSYGGGVAEIKVNMKIGQTLMLSLKGNI